MEKSKLYTLGKQERLKSRKAIELLFKTGKSFSIFPFRIVYQMAAFDPVKDNSQLQAGFAVSTKHFKKAVDRNRARRQMKEAYRLQKNDLQEMVLSKPDKLYIFFIYTAKELPSYQLVFEKTKLVLERLIKIAVERK